MRSDRIIEVFEANGCALSSLRLAQKCIEAGIFEEYELNNATVRWAQTVVRDALREKLAEGIPYAAPTAKKDASGNPIWLQYRLWDYDDAAFILRERCEALMGDYKPIVALRDYIIERWGTAPEIPQIVTLSLPQLALTP